MKRGLLIVLLLLPSVISAQWMRDGKELPDNAWLRSKAGLSTMLLTTKAGAAFIEQFSRNPQALPEFDVSERVMRGETLAAMLFFKGCLPGPSGVCDGTVDFTVLRPDGSIYGQAKGGPLFVGKLAPGRVLPSSSSLKIGIEPQDPLGVYTVKAHVRDNIAGVDLDMERRFEVLVDREPANRHRP